jgi:NAD(P)-dependent dehydrogenase (short-subunit alcohol dehydrogenase family)
VTSTAHFVFNSKTAVVTATSGIGLAIARGLQAAGAQVICAGLPPQNPADLDGFQFLPLDVTQGDQVKGLFEGLQQLDILVNAAGINRRAAEHDPEVFEQVVDVNLHGTMRCCQAAKPLLFASRGTVVNIASMLSFFGGGHAPGYTASKGGVAQLTKALANAWALDGVRVNAIAPGYVETKLTQALWEDPARIQARIPMGRWAQPQDMVGPTLFLCSDAAAYVTGAILPVDGGYLAY